MDPSLAGLDDVLISGLLIVIGFVATALSLYRREETNPLLASFGLFSTIYGVRLLFNNPMSASLGISAAASVWVTSLATYTILVPAWYFFWKLLGDGLKGLNRWWVRVVAVFAVVGIVCDFVLRTPASLAAVNNVFVILGLGIIVASFWSRRGQMTPDLRILMVGLLVFGAIALNANLAPLGLLPWRWQSETFGFLFFVFCLGWIAARRFVTTERDLASVEGELQAAQKIQASILPASPPQLEGLSIATRFQPSSAIAGDYFDFLTPSSRQVGIVIADVSGHGVPAALIASMVKVAVAAHGGSANDPADLLLRVNQTLCGSFQHGFVSIALLFLDLEKREAVVSSGGHPYPLLKRRSESRIREVGGAGTILGRFPDATFAQETIQLEPGDRWLLFTDGVVEARNPDDEMFGEQRLQDLLINGDKLSAEELCETVMGEVDRWIGIGAGEALEDDLTLLVVDHQGVESEA